MTYTIDEALILLNETGPEYSRGLSNHGPMCAEALISLGQSDKVVPWLEEYKRSLDPMPPKHDPINSNNYVSALGDINRYQDWLTFFKRELQERPWKETLNQWVDRLSPGYIAAAMHGVIRTGHAVRSLSKGESSERTLELAQGLAYWAARYQHLNENETTTTVYKSVNDALTNVALLPVEKRQSLGLITKEIETAASMDSFPEVINFLSLNNPPATTLSQLTETFAFMFLCNAEATGMVIALVHALTGPYALRHMLPYLELPIVHKAMRYSWQSSAVLYARYGLGLESSKRDAIEVCSESELVDRAVTTRDEHAVKFTEACLTEHKINPNPVYLSAAALCSRLMSDSN